MSNEGWFADPAGAHELRYFDGASWTDYVSDRGSYAVAPLGTAPPSWYPPLMAAPPPSAPAATRTGLVVGIAAGVLAVAVGALTVYFFAVSGRSTHTSRTAAQPTATSTPAPSASRGFANPILKPVPPFTVVGPTFAKGEASYPMSFGGWPFAFRVPATWGCLRGKVDSMPEARGYVCIDEGHPASQQRAHIMFRPCPTACTPAQQQTMSKQWFDAPGRTPTSRDATTSYIETPRDEKGLYSLDMSHFFGEAPGRPLKWQVGIFVESPPGTRGDVQKIVNDVRSQTP